MKTLSIDLAAANVIALDTDLRAVLTSHFFGLTYDGKQVTLVLDETVTNNQIQQAQNIVATHDPAKLTPAQQAEVLQNAKLDQARKDYAATELDLTIYQGKDALLQKLAEKVLWLERELNALCQTQ
ncbi:MAG: hypothetical protein GC179_20625 [Anaerolineaceae bacterium]|nr:hypothetical protein [Anaerolineaceae bacterium]